MRHRSKAPFQGTLTTRSARWLKINKAHVRGRSPEYLTLRSADNGTPAVTVPVLGEVRRHPLWPLLGQQRTQGASAATSALGQKRTSTALLRVSALGPAADVKAVALARPLCTQNRKSASEFDVLSAMPILRSHAFAAAPLPKVADSDHVSLHNHHRRLRRGVRGAVARRCDPVASALAGAGERDGHRRDGGVTSRGRGRFAMAA